MGLTGNHSGADDGISFTIVARAKRRAAVARAVGRQSSDTRVGKAAARRVATTRYLLNVNVLIALIDPAHGQHDAAHGKNTSTNRIIVVQVFAHRQLL